MNCFFHDNKPAVVACAKCGIGLCRECMNNTAYTYDGKPICLNCSKPIAQEELKEAQSSGTWSLVKFLFSGFFIGIGLAALASGAELMQVWMTSGVAGIPTAFKETRRSREQRIMDEIEDRYKKDIMDLMFGWALRLLVKLALIILLAPIYAIYTCISNLITFLNSKKKTKEAKKALDYIEQCLNEEVAPAVEQQSQVQSQIEAPISPYVPLQPETPQEPVASYQFQTNIINTPAAETFQSNPPASSYQAPIAAKKNRSKAVGGIVMAIFILTGLVAGYFLWYVPYSIDKNAARYYTFTNLNLRSSQITDVEYNLIKTLPYGSELITYSKDDEWSSVKANGIKGFVSSSLLLSAEDFHLMNSAWGNTDAKECIFTAKCRLAILDYYKRANLQGGTEWQIYTKKKDDKSNTVFYPRLFNKSSKFTDFLFIVKNNQTNKRMLVFYSFHDETEAPIFRHDIETTQEGYITGVTSFWTQDGLQTSIAFSNGEIKKTLIKAERPVSTATLPKPSIQITNVYFCETDIEGKTITESGNTLYTDLRFLKPIITYDVLTQGEVIDIWYKLYSPDGVLQTSNESKKGFTWKGSINRNKDQETTSLGGFGNMNQNAFNIEGLWRIEFYENDICLNKSSVKIHKR